MIVATGEVLPLTASWQKATVFLWETERLIDARGRQRAALRASLRRPWRWYRVPSQALGLAGRRHDIEKRIVQLRAWQAEFHRELEAVSA